MIADVVVFSLERWDEIWRRNQFIVRELLDLWPDARFLFVAPPVDVRIEKRPVRASLREIQAGRLWQLTPSKWLPRVAGPFADRSLYGQVDHACAALGFDQPALWVNDSVYAFYPDTGRLPTVYDITDDWLLLSIRPRDRRRRELREARLMNRAHGIVVCSRQLARSRGSVRTVHHVGNAVDIVRYQTPMPRPHDMPSGPTAVYVGTLQDDRLDIDLITALADQDLDCTSVLIGPDCLNASSRRRLSSRANVRILGPRPYQDVPGYLQHASVLIVPHRLSPFTESLDPIKAYECEAVGVVTVATPVAGFEESRRNIRIAPPTEWVSEVRRALVDAPETQPCATLPTWRERALLFSEVLEQAISDRLAPQGLQEGV